MLRREADLLSEIDDLLFGQDLLRLAGARLQLSRARQHPLESTAVESGLRVGSRQVRIGSHIAKYTAGCSGQIPPSTTSIWRVNASRIASGVTNVAVKSDDGSPARPA